MDAEHTASAGSEERPPLGSDGAIGKIAEAIRDHWDRGVREEWEDLQRIAMRFNLIAIMSASQHFSMSAVCSQLCL